MCEHIFSTAHNVVDQRSGDSNLNRRMTSQSIEGKHFPDFEMLDAKIAFALRKIISNSHFKRRVHRMESSTAELTDEGMSILWVYDGWPELREPDTTR